MVSAGCYCKQEIQNLSIGVASVAGGDYWSNVRQRPKLEGIQLFIPVFILTLIPCRISFHVATTTTTTHSTNLGHGRTAVSKAKILASNEMYIKSGSDINLTCVARQAPLPPLFIYWYKNGHLINHSNRGGININTERLSRTSKLVITRATTADSGNYTCAPSDSGKSVSYLYAATFSATWTKRFAERCWRWCCWLWQKEVATMH